MRTRTRSRCSTECISCCFVFQAEDGIRDLSVTGVQTCALPISCSGDIPELLARRLRAPRANEGHVSQQFGNVARARGDLPAALVKMRPVSVDLELIEAR